MHRRRTLAPSPPPGVKPYDLERLERERARLEDAKRRLVKSLRISEETKRALEQDGLNIVDGASKRDDTDAQVADSTTTAAADNGIAAPPPLGSASPSKEPKQLRWRSSIARRDQSVQQGCQMLEGATAVGSEADADARETAAAQILATPDSSIETGPGGSGIRSSMMQRPQMSASSSRAPSPSERRGCRTPSDKVAFGSRVPRQSSPGRRRPSPRRTGSPRQRPLSARNEEMIIKGNSIVVAAAADNEPAGSSKECSAAHSPTAFGGRQASSASTLSEVNRDTDSLVTVLGVPGGLPLEPASSFSESSGSLGTAATMKYGIRSQNGQPDCYRSWSNHDAKEENAKLHGNRDVENRMPQRNCMQRAQGQSKVKSSASGSSIVTMPPPVPSAASSRASSCRTKQRPNSSRPGSPTATTVRQASNGRRLPQSCRGPSSSPVNSRPLSRRGSVSSSCAAPSASRTPTRPSSRTPAGRTPAHTPADRTPADRTPADRTPADQTPADRSPCNSEARSPVVTPTASWAPAVSTAPSNLLVKGMQENFDQAVQQQWQLLHQQWPIRPDPEDHQSESSAPSTPVSVTLLGAARITFADGDAQECGLECLECPREPLSGISTATPATGATGTPEEEERTPFEGQSAASLDAQLPTLPASPSAPAAAATVVPLQAPLALPLPAQPSGTVLLGSATASARLGAARSGQRDDPRLMSAAEFDELVAVVRGGSPSPRAEATLPKPLRVMKAGEDPSEWHVSEPPKTPGHPLEAPLVDSLTCPMLRRRSAEVIAPRAELSATPKAPGPTLARAAPMSPTVSLAESPEEMAVSTAEPLREWPLTASPSARARLARPVTAAGAAASIVQVTPMVTPVPRRSSIAATLQTPSPTPTTTKTQSAGAASPSVSSARACVRPNGTLSWAEVVQPVRTAVATSLPLDPVSADVASPNADGPLRAQPPSVQVQISAPSQFHGNQASHSPTATVLRSSVSTPVLPITGDESTPSKARIVRLHKR